MTQKVYWTGEVPERDDFGILIKKVFYDGKTKWGPWAIMAESMWKVQGCGRLGLGAGQKYERQTDGKWLKVEG